MKNSFILLISLLVSTPLFSQTLSADTLHWSANKKLTWNDFKGKPSDELETGECLMVMQASFVKKNPLKPAIAAVVAVFDRKHSHTAIDDRTAQELKYYQVMFDIYEVYSRKLRQEFKNTKFGLDPDKIFQEKYSKGITALDERVRKYRNDTNQGESNAELLKWEKQIALELKELEKFSSK